MAAIFSRPQCVNCDGRWRRIKKPMYYYLKQLIYDGVSKPCGRRKYAFFGEIMVNWTDIRYTDMHVILLYHEGVIKREHFARYRPIGKGIHRSPGDSKCHRWVPLTKASDAELWCFIWSVPEQTVMQRIRTPVIWDAIAFIMTSLKLIDLLRHCHDWERNDMAGQRFADGISQCVFVNEVIFRFQIKVVLMSRSCLK